jgi:putative addiction module component (TIGR02574 family)
MAKNRQILADLLRLPASERARLAAALVLSLDESKDPDAAQAWLEELDRRARDVVDGTAQLEDWTEVRDRIEARLRARKD